LAGQTRPRFRCARGSDASLVEYGWKEWVQDRVTGLTSLNHKPPYPFGGLAICRGRPMTLRPHLAVGLPFRVRTSERAIPTNLLIIRLFLSDLQGPFHTHSQGSRTQWAWSVDRLRRLR